MTVPALELHSGDQLPIVGLGFWKVATTRVASLVQEAISVGYRHLDSACDYGNEREIGEGLRLARRERLCDRDDLWITSKLWNTYHRREHVRLAAEKTLRDLQLDHLDLYLIHFPIALRFVPFEDRYPPEWVFDPTLENPRLEPDPVPISETWQAMEELVKAGLVKNIGVCNFGCSLLRDLLSYAEIAPAVLQVESHPHLVQPKLLRFCQEQGIAFTASSPLGALSYLELDMAAESESLLTHPLICKIASAHGKTPAQVILRWGVQRQSAIVPKTSKRERLVENLDIFDFQLGQDEMTEISSLDQHRRFNDPGAFAEKAFNTFFPIYD